MKDRISNSRTVAISNNAATGAAGSDVILTEVETGTARNGQLILTVDAAASSDAMENICLYTTNTSDLVATGTDGGTSDLATIVAEDTVNGAGSDVTIASNVIAKINQDGIYIFHVENLKRYCQIQYNSAGTGSKVTATLVAYDLMESPYAAARTAY
jgi:hypothetical protein